MIFSFLKHTEKTFRNIIRTFRLNQVKLLFLVLLIGVAACDKIPDGVVDIKYADYIVNQITAPDSIASTSADTSFVTTLKIDNIESVAEVWCSVKILNGKENIYDKIVLLDTGFNGDVEEGDNIFTGKISMNAAFANGYYIIEYYVKDNINQGSENVKLVGVHSFIYNNGTNNNPPVISDLVIPNSVNRDEVFIITLKVSDPDGLEDISQVEFALYDPTGAYVASFPLVDDGNLENNGDENAGDGIFSSKRSFKANVFTGTWKFIFHAKDKGGLSSNSITHDLLVN